MSIRPFRDIKRKITKEINVGKVKVGGKNPISVQSMTNTVTKDIKKTINQVNQISEELLEKYINERLMATKRMTTVRTEISIIRHFFKTYLIKRGYVFRLPAFPEFRIRYKDRAKREDTFTIKEWQKLYKYLTAGQVYYLTKETKIYF